MPTRLFALLSALLFTCLLRPVSAQNPAAEMRGAWVATIVNIDWPSNTSLTANQQQVQFDSILDVLKGIGMNAVFVQIRPAGDAFYPSQYAPWSKYLSGTQGTDPGYDPLDYMVKAAHKRKMEFHAWLNPYRATFDLDTAGLAPGHLLKSLPQEQRREWFFRYGRRFYFNPANPAVIKHLTDVVGEIITRYDVDGIHFDDYFYPYKEDGATLNDYFDFSRDTRGFTAIEDWRRDNVNRLIQSVSQKIKTIKPYVRFGISPFGVWRNKSVDPLRGSDTRAGLTCYDDLYADVLKWLENDWIDYVAPQIYWSRGFPAADYEKLVDWWSKNLYGKHLYIGHATYKIGNSPNDPNWNRTDETSRQIALNRSNRNVQGSIHFSTVQLLKNPLGVSDTLRTNLYSTPALMPGMPFRTKILPATPTICRVKGSPSTVKFSWNACDITMGEEMPYYFGIYRFFGEGVGDFSDPRNLIATTPFNAEEWIYEDSRVYPAEKYTYVVVAFNRMNVPSYSSSPVMVKKTKKTARKKRKLFGLYL